MSDGARVPIVVPPAPGTLAEQFDRAAEGLDAGVTVDAGAPVVTVTAAKVIGKGWTVAGYVRKVISGALSAGVGLRWRPKA